MRTSETAGAIARNVRIACAAAIALTLLGFAAFWTACSGPGETLEQAEGAKSEQLVVPGSGICERVLGLLAQAFGESGAGVEVIVPPSTGTSGGIHSVATGETPLGRVGRPLKEDEKAKGLVFEAFANDMVVFAVGEAVKIESLTAEQLTAVFKGKIVNWGELGLEDAPIRVLGRQPGEVALETIAKHIESFRDQTFAQEAKIAFHDGEMVDLLNKYPTSIGFLTLSSVRAPGNKMEAIALDGAAPTIENAASGKYPLVTTAGFVYRESGLSKPARAFVDFVFSEAGSRIILETGMAPIARR